MLIECRNITYAYPDTPKTILNDISFNIKRPGFHALFGPSGVGKTSFAKILSGQVNGYEGQIKQTGSNVLYTYNLERLPGWSSVGAHINKITPHSKQELKQELIEVFGLQEIIGMGFTRLSLGQKNRVNLLRYLLQDFDTLIMDESLANVDEIKREEIILKMKSLFGHTCMLYISHNIVEVAKFCDSIVIFRDAEKNPQTHTVKGCNHTIEGKQMEEDVNRRILEIMHAS